VDKVADAIRNRVLKGKNFSIVAVAEGAMPEDFHRQRLQALEQRQQAISKDEKKAARAVLAELERQQKNHTMELGLQLEELTGLETRVTILGYLQRGGAPSAADRLLATRLGSACVKLIEENHYGVMVAAQGEQAVPVPLEEVAGYKKTVPLDHSWIESARHVGTCFGDD
jgi:6-phosphofructokinase 1